MAAYNEHCKNQKSHKRNSFRWHKSQRNRLLRREAKRNPDDAVRKAGFRGYYS